MERYSKTDLLLGRYALLLLLIVTLMSCRKLENETAGAGGLIPVTVDFNIAPQMNGTLSETKATGQAVTVNVDNIWVVQFDGTGSDAVPAVPPQYIDDYSSNSLLYFLPLQRQCTICFLANTFDESLLSGMNDMTLSEYMNLGYNIGSEKDICKNEVTPVLSGSLNLVVKETANTIGECQLSRNYANIKFVITNSSNSLTFTGFYVENVPDKIAYTCDSPLSESYKGDVIQYEINPSSQSSGSIEYCFCVPPNEQGTVVGADELNKNKKAPERAMNVKLYALSSSGREFIYTFYLGANLSDNFDILSNYSYEYHITFNSEGRTSTDSRIWKSNTSSNCFISKTNTPISVKLGKVDEFWGNNGYENVEDYTLGSDKQWTASVLWADIPLDNVVLTKSSGKGSSDFFTCKSSSEGNAVVAVKVNDVIVWSYHLWFCNEDLESKAVEWKGNVFMDRNIGAASPEFSSSNLYYEFGRKDPFPLDHTIYGETITFSTSRTPGWSSNKSNILLAIHNPTIYMSDQGSIFDNWTGDDSYNPNTTTQQIWYDPKSLDNGVVVHGYKSIFDPCPEGWKMPELSEMTDISNTLYNKDLKSRIFTDGLVFPYVGIYDHYSKKIEEVGTEGYYWFSSSHTYDTGYELFMSKSSCYSYHDAKSSACPVRCIKE